MEEKKLTGYPSIDKPWLKYYSEEAIHAPLPECTIYEYLMQSMNGHLDRIAISYYGRQISYRTLLKNIHRVANAFAALGVKTGDIVAIALPNIPENIYCIYALNMLGATADMIDLRSKGDTLLKYIQESGTKIVVICDLFAENMRPIAAKTQVSTVIAVSLLSSLPFPLRLYKRSRVFNEPPVKTIRWNRFISHKDDVKFNINRDAEGVACIAHTSGTTNRPKGVLLTNRNINSLISQYVSIGFSHDISDCMLNQVPPFLAYSFLSFHFPFALHMKVILLPDYRPDRFADNLQKYSPNHVCAGPGDWENLLTKSQKQLDYSFLKTLASGSDHLNMKSKEAITEVLRKGNCQNGILEGYGMTECGSAAALQLPLHTVDDSVGIPLPKNIFCIYDNEAERELTYDALGEICICGPSVMKGYFKNKSESEHTLRIHSDGKQWLHTGDIGTIDRDGNVYLVGRMKRIIVLYDGIKVYPSNLENVIMKNPAISACCAVGTPDIVHGRGFVPVVFVTLHSAYDQSKVIGELDAMCKAELSEKYLPAAIRFITALPLTPNGKVDYRALERMAAEARR